MFAIALWALRRNSTLESAVVALEALARAGHRVLAGRLVVRQGNRAVPAFELFAAGATEDGEGIAAAIEQDDGLLSALQSLLCLIHKRPREELLLAGLLILASHVD